MQSYNQVNETMLLFFASSSQIISKQFVQNCWYLNLQGFQSFALNARKIFKIFFWGEGYFRTTILFKQKPSKNILSLNLGSTDLCQYQAPIILIYLELTNFKVLIMMGDSD